MHINLAQDALGDELASSDLDKREIELDKLIIKLIQAACKADKAPRVLELTKRLHFTHSIAAASQLAGFYKLLGLQEKIEAIKRWRKDGQSPTEEARERRRRLEQEDAYMERPKLLQNFDLPPKVERPGLTRSAGVVERSEFTSLNVPARPFDIRYAPTATRSTSPDGKRKRGEVDDLASNGFDAEVKRRAVGEIIDSCITSPKREQGYTQTLYHCSTVFRRQSIYPQVSRGYKEESLCTETRAHQTNPKEREFFQQGRSCRERPKQTA